jgi:tungstate transport system substrate-binding protein
MLTEIFTIGGRWTLYMPMDRRRLLAALGVGSAVGLAGCTDGIGSLGGRQEADLDWPGGQLTLAATTSTYDSGLIDALLPAFRRSVGARVKPVVKGSGAALRTAANGDADLVLVHDRGAEDEFLRAGHGVNRRDVMANDFVVVGPADDPADIHGTENVTDALAAIARAEALFVSRGDDSGTHRKERELWRAAGVQPGGEWYQETGQGQGETLVQADVRGAYALVDRGTYRSMASELDLVVHVQGPMEDGPERLRNPYGAVVANPARHEVAYPLAMAFVGFLTGQRGQALIADHTANGRRMFEPTALSGEPDFGQYVPRRWDAEGSEP